MAESVEAIVIGAGPAGLAAAAALKTRGAKVAILAKSDAVGAVWRRVRGDIARLEADAVVFAASAPFDAVILATGFRPDLSALLPGAEGVLSDSGKPLASGVPTAEPGLFFCGAIASPTGRLREIGIEATRVADAAMAMRPGRAAAQRAG
jgi:thioredoxin reductase